MIHFLLFIGACCIVFAASKDGWKPPTLGDILRDIFKTTEEFEAEEAAYEKKCAEEEAYEAKYRRTREQSKWTD